MVSLVIVNFDHFQPVTAIIAAEFVIAQCYAERKYVAVYIAADKFTQIHHLRYRKKLNIVNVTHYMNFEPWITYFFVFEISYLEFLEEPEFLP